MGSPQLSVWNMQRMLFTIATAFELLASVVGVEAELTGKTVCSRSLNKVDTFIVVHSASLPCNTDEIPWEFSSCLHQSIYGKTGFITRHFI